jgi:hypothetical protein
MPKNLVVPRLLHYFPKKNPKSATLRFGSYLFLFQITASSSHPVNCAGLVELFPELKPVEKIKKPKADFCCA